MPGRNNKPLGHTAKVAGSLTNPTWGSWLSLLSYLNEHFPRGRIIGVLSHNIPFESLVLWINVREDKHLNLSVLPSLAYWFKHWSQREPPIMSSALGVGVGLRLWSPFSLHLSHLFFAGAENIKQPGNVSSLERNAPITSVLLEARNVR